MKNVVFIGGNSHYQSVRIRCIEVARLLGCRHVSDAVYARIPADADVFVCVKPRLSNEELAVLSRRGRIIWDVIDYPPPPLDCVREFISSTSTAAGVLGRYGAVTVIPHYHCNFSRRPNTGRDRVVGWIGSPHWQPSFSGAQIRCFDTSNMSREEVEDAYRSVDIVLNLRREATQDAWHRVLSSGIKLINCIGFGIPSVSSDEAAYREVGEPCTLFAGPEGWAEALERLRTDAGLYELLRHECLSRAQGYHVEAILSLYRRLLSGAPRGAV